MDELDKVIVSIISETIEQKNNKNILPVICTHKEFFKELKARALLQLENMTDTGMLHTGSTARDIYYEFN